MSEQIVLSWDRLNKNLVREEKRAFIEDYMKGGFISRSPRMLSLSGPDAYLERILSEDGLVLPEKMVAVESDKRLVERLEETRDAFLPGMRICHGTLSAFANSNLGLGPFDIVDADFCGTFSERLDGSVLRLLNNGEFSKKTLLFVNLSKGHDVLEKTKSLLGDYFSSAREKNGNLFIDLEKMNFYRELVSEIDHKIWWHAVRYYLVPAYYVCRAYDAGYVLSVEKLFEYRDSHNPMLQWTFYLQKHEHKYNKNLEMLKEELSRIKKRGYDKHDLQRDR